MKKGTRLVIYTLFGVFTLFLGLTFFNYSKDEPTAGILITAPVLKVLTVADYWNKQAEAADQAGQPEVAINYRNRITAYSTYMGSPAPDFPQHVSSIIPASFELYLQSPKPAVANAPKLAKHEPISGTYLGMLGADRRVGYDVTKIEQVYGRKHALYLSYVGWRKLQTDTDTYFPKRTADRVKAMDGALQIGWEPRYGLDDVKDDEYVRRFAREAKESGIPIFLRYASEMNGAWVPWHGEPAKYIEKFRLIHDIMKEEAPNVAMVWSPNFWPPDNIDEYYPGDAYVDWVGFSLYATPLSDGKVDLTGNVIDDFTLIYEKYNHKPIMIAEGAVAHTVLPSGESYWQWAEGQLGYLYAFLPRLFPQVKGITYFNFSRAQALRNNMTYVYDIGENPYTDGLYKRIISSNWFHSQVDQIADPVRHQYKPMDKHSLPEGKHTVMVYTQLEDGSWPYAVALYQGNDRLGISFEMPWEIDITISSPQALKPLQVVAYNEKMEPIAVSSHSAASALK